MDYLEPFLRAIVGITAVIVLTRINGLRSFAKISAFDFALTVATGSVLASVILPDGSLGVGLASLAAIYFAQRSVSALRARHEVARDLADNAPLLLMDGPEILYDNLRAARVPYSDLLGKLREANVLGFEEVRAVVLETTGDISVLHRPSGRTKLDDALMAQVRRK